MLRPIIAGLVLGSVLLRAQSPVEPKPEPTSAERIKMLERQIAQQKRTMRDWGGLLRYGSDNTELPKLKPGEQRVIFFGDQITEMWGETGESFFPGKPWLNRGVAGQTTDQMLIRFRQDVISLHPTAVVILGGLNDVAGLRGVNSTETIFDNLASMTQLAQANGLKVVLASLTPVCDCFTTRRVRERWQDRISEINERIKRYSQQAGTYYVDYFSALASDDDFKRELTKDGVMPNQAGYRVMASLAEEVLAQALKKN